MPKEIRKRRKSASKKPSTALIKSVIRSMPMDVDPGYTRSSGFYGRFGKGGELKFFDTSLSFLIDATGEVPATGQLALIPQGVTESTRVGRKCTIKSIAMKGNLLYAPAAAASGSTNAVMYLVLDKQCNGAAAGATDVFTGTNFVTLFHNLANSQRFVVLKTWKWTINSSAGATTAYNNVSRMWSGFKKCNIPIEYSSTTGAITEIRSNNLFLLASSDGTSDDLITIGGTCRLRFSDQ